MPSLIVICLLGQPSLEVFGCYARVERIIGEPVTVAEFLNTLRQVVARHALARVLERQELGAVDASTASYAQDLRSLLEEADFTESKTFLRSFVKRIVVNGDKAEIQYQLPMPPDGKKIQSLGILPIDTPTGPNITFAKPIDTFFEVSITSAPSPFGERNYEPR